MPAHKESGEDNGLRSHLEEFGVDLGRDGKKGVEELVGDLHIGCLCLLVLPWLVVGL